MTTEIQLRPKQADAITPGRSRLRKVKEQGGIPAAAVSKEDKMLETSHQGDSPGHGATPVDRALGTRVTMSARCLRYSVPDVNSSVASEPSADTSGGEVSLGASSAATPPDITMSRTVHPQLQTPVVNALVAIGANIQQARKSAFRMTRQRFAQALGCTAITLDRIERGDPGVAAVYYFAALEITRCLSRLVEITDPSALVVSMAPISWPDDAGGDFPDLAAALGDSAAGGSIPPPPAPAPAPAAALEPKPTPAAPKQTHDREPAPKPSPEKKVTGYGAVITPPWARR